MIPDRAIALDFDGVLHAYHSGWTGPIPTDPPVPGAAESVAAIRALGFRVVVFSCRALVREGRDGIQAWLEQHRIAVDEITGVKPHAVLYVDDRAVRFDGSWEEIVRLARDVPRPWNAGHTAARPLAPGRLPTCGSCGVVTNAVTPLGRYEACGHLIPGHEKHVADAAHLVIDAEAQLLAEAPPHELECVCVECLRWTVRNGELCETVNGLGFENPAGVLREAALAKALLEGSHGHA